jgi:hypothetical protein
MYSKQAIYKHLRMDPPDATEIEKRLIQSVQGRKTFKPKYFDEMTLELLLHLKQLTREPTDYEEMVNYNFSASDMRCLERLLPEMVDLARLLSNPFAGIYHLIKDERVQTIMGYNGFKERAMGALMQINTVFVNASHLEQQILFKLYKHCWHAINTR